MTHYLLIVGDNNTGKSNILLVFSLLAYRPILDTCNNTSQYLQLWKSIEEGQCIILEDEIDDIDDQDDEEEIIQSQL